MDEKYKLWSCLWNTISWNVTYAPISFKLVTFSKYKTISSYLSYNFEDIKIPLVQRFIKRR